VVGEKFSGGMPRAQSAPLIDKALDVQDEAGWFGDDPVILGSLRERTESPPVPADGEVSRMPEHDPPRAFLRYLVQLPLYYQRGRPSRQGVGVGWTRNLSEGGACIELAEPFDVSAEIQLGLQTYLGGVRLQCQVVWRDMADASGRVLHGVKFLNLSAGCRLVLQQMLRVSSAQPHSLLRRACEVPLVCTVRGSRGRSWDGRTGNIGPHGLLAHLPEDLPVGTDVDLTCNPPHDGPVRLGGRIAWVEGRDATTRRATTRHGIWIPEFPGTLFQRLLDRSAGEARNPVAGRPDRPPEKVGAPPGHDTVWLTGSRDAKRTGILIVDDDPGLLGSVCAMLELIGYPAFPARTGREAVSLLRQHTQEIGLVLLDLHLGGENTEKVFDDLRQVHPKVSVLLMSGEPEEMALERFGRAGLDGFLYKPLGVPQWVGRIEQLLAR
jgi:CheY-like chemotaxis protein